MGLKVVRSVVFGVIFVFVLTLLVGSGNVFANDGTVNTTFFGSFKDDGNGCSVYMLLNFIIDILTFGVGIVAVIGITVSGITYLTAGGNETQTIKAKRRIYEIVIGLVAYVLLWALLSFLLPGGTLSNNTTCPKASISNNSFWTEPTETSGINKNEKNKNNTTGKNKNNTTGKNNNSSTSEPSNSSASDIESQSKVNYKVYLSGKVNPAKLKKGSGIIVVEPDDYKASQIKIIKKKGYTVLAYLSVGSYEGEREGKSYYSGLKQYKAQKMANWPENYAKVEKPGWQKYLLSRAATFKKTGYDGVWADNLDVYEYRKSNAVYNACKKILASLKKYGYVMVNGGREFFEKAMSKKVKLNTMVSGVTQEEVFSLIEDYGGRGTFEAQSSGDSKAYQAYMKKLKNNGVQTFLLEYSRDNNIKKKIKSFCEKYGMTGYYISPDVDLYPPKSIR